MAHSFRIHYFHLIWSTKQRRPQITTEIQSRLYSYLEGIVSNHSGKLLEIGGMPDHVHLLIELSNIDKFSEFVRDLKACSSLWIHKNFADLNDFSWQEGYGSFSVGYSTLENVRNYIRNQKVHHKDMSFDDEYLKLLKMNCVIYDERFVLG
jgi:putative transposase